MSPSKTVGTEFPGRYEGLSAASWLYSQSRFNRRALNPEAGEYLLVFVQDVYLPGAILNNTLFL